MATLALFFLFAAPQTHYSTCPAFEDAIRRNVVYVDATEAELRRWASKQVVPKNAGAREKITVQVQIEDQAVFCAQALDGSPAKQKPAVEAAMKWKFKRKRGEFKEYLLGPIVFEF
jgi:hypothetical protein